jgi:hypothetical protein
VSRDYKDLVIEQLADDEAALVDFLVDLVLDNLRLWKVLGYEYRSRIHGDAAIAHLKKRLYEACRTKTATVDGTEFPQQRRCG